jgi:hypothetical protein
MPNAKVVQRVLIDRHPATQPAIGIVASTQTSQFPPAANIFLRGVQPQSDQQPWIRGGTPGIFTTGGNGSIECREIQLLNHSPNHPRIVIRGQQTLQMTGVKQHLLAIRPTKTNRAIHGFRSSNAQKHPV